MKYTVVIYEVYSRAVSVEADSESDARTKAEELIWHGNYKDGSSLADPEYDYTMSADEWIVIKSK